LKSRTRWILLILLMVFAGAIRIWGAMERPLSIYEIWTWRDSKVGVANMIRWQHHYEHSPLIYILVRISEKVFQSEAEWVLRFPSLLGGMLCIPAAFALGRVVGSRSLGLVAAALVAFDPNLTVQSMEARMYALFMLFFLLALCWLVLLHQRWVDRGWAWMVFGIWLSLLYWSSNLGLVAGIALLITLLVWALQEKRNANRDNARRVLIGTLISFGLAAAACHVGFLHLAQRIAGGGRSVGVKTQTGILGSGKETCEALGRLYEWPLLSGAIILLAVTGIYALSRRSKPLAWSIAIVAILNLGGVALLRTDHHYVAARYLTAVQPFIWLGVSASIVHGLERRRVLSLFSLGTLIALFIVCNAFSLVVRPNADSILSEQMRQLSRRVDQEDRVAFYPEYLLQMSKYYHFQDRYLATEKILSGTGWADELNSRPARVWLVVGRISRQNPVSEADETFNPLVRFFAGEYDLGEFRKLLEAEKALVIQIGPKGVEYYGLRRRGRSLLPKVLQKVSP